MDLQYTSKETTKIVFLFISDFFLVQNSTINESGLTVIRNSLLFFFNPYPRTFFFSLLLEREREGGREDGGERERAIDCLLMHYDWGSNLHPGNGP